MNKGQFTNLMSGVAQVCVVAAILICSAVTAAAQSSRRDAAAIRYAKRVAVSRIESGMPAKRFETWLREAAGKGMKYKWEVNDCGEQTGTPADRGRDFPMCVEVSGESFDLAVTVVLGVGTFKRGIFGSPGLRGLKIDQEGEEAIELKKLSELRSKLNEVTGRN